MRTLPYCALAAILLAGCSEEVLFRSSPPAARVSVDDVYIGDTPTHFTTHQVIPRTYRVEMQGYPPVEGQLEPHLAPGRVIGAIFTLGIVALARPMYYYRPNPVDVTFGTGSIISARSIAKLYNLATGDVAVGSCDVNGNCVVTFPSGISCPGDRRHRFTQALLRHRDTQQEASTAPAAQTS